MLNGNFTSKFQVQCQRNLPFGQPYCILKWHVIVTSLINTIEMQSVVCIYRWTFQCSISSLCMDVYTRLIYTFVCWNFKVININQEYMSNLMGGCCFVGFLSCRSNGFESITHRVFLTTIFRYNSIWYKQNYFLNLSTIKNLSLFMFITLTCESTS